MILWIIGVVWWIIGFGSHMYWWTKEYDYQIPDFFLGIIVGIVGPLGYFIGWFIHRDLENDPIILINKKEEK